MAKQILINATQLPHATRHAFIFESFDELQHEDAIILVNDHDPKPLYYHLQHEKGSCFSWSYLAQGPDIWKVLITKTEQNNKPLTIGEMARKDYRNAEVFKKLGIDFCCGGKKSLEEVCANKGLDVNAVKQELEKSSQMDSRNAQHDFDAWPASFLADYIVNVHHKYVRDNIQLLDELSEKVARKHGEQFTQLPEIRNCVTQLLEELSVHLQKEEQILFPYIKQLEQNKTDQQTPCKSFRSVQQPINVMEDDHDHAGNLLKQIRKLTDNYTTPPNACNSFNFLYKKLEEFEGDLHQHIHLENNILFEKALLMEGTIV